MPFHLLLFVLAFSPATAGGDSIDVTPGRDPEAVRTELRKHLDELVAKTVRSSPALPPDSDARVRLEFTILADGAIATSNHRPSDSPNKSLTAWGLVLSPGLLVQVLPQVVHFPRAPVPVDVEYEFTARGWAEDRIREVGRWVQHDHELCALLPQFQRAPDETLEHELAVRRKQLPSAFRADGDIVNFLSGVKEYRDSMKAAGEPMEDAAHQIAVGVYLDLCQLTGTDPTKACPALVPLLTKPKDRTCKPDEFVGWARER